ncbi:MAG: L-threonylcarbamoyladenylate synthase [Acidobacteriota bacterium]|nr:L-threonylcarbamoyladenylate synthase [Acidobacteriota bacterium]
MASGSGGGELRFLDSPSEEQGAEVRRMAAELRSGAVVAFPTETFYALGADPRSPEAVAEVFRLKGRPGDRRLPWIAANRAQVEAVCVLAERASTLADRCWPGPVSLVLPLRGAGGGNVAVRVSSHPLARALAAALGHPVISTSANPTGAPPLTTAAEVRDAFAGRGAERLRILDGGRTPGGEPSVIVDVTGGSPRVLRGTFDPGLLL